VRREGDRGSEDLQGRPPVPAAERQEQVRTEVTSPEGASDQKKKRGALGTAIEVLIIIIAAFAIAMLVQAFLVKPFTIHQISMLPTLEEGDRILINRLAYSFRDPEAGDIVVFQSPMDSGDDLVKRIVAVGGDRVAISDGTLYVNGEAQDEPYLLDRGFRGQMAETTVPPDHVFVLGDNRNNSGDSRLFGPIDEDSLVGSAFLIYWPIGRWSTP
jgi:signal peptidase I